MTAGANCKAGEKKEDALMAVASPGTFSSPVSAAEFGVHVQDPIEHLQDCHERIERSLVTVKNAVAGLCLTEPVLRAEAAAALDYELALLQLLSDLHTQDEEKSLFPRLQKNLSADSDSLRELITILESQHREQQAIFGQLATCLRNFPATERPAAEERLTRLESLVGQLENVFRPHMTLEDERVIPNCRLYLTQADLDGMQQEMRLRFRV
jgi:iron-sulfur cluster repair protein YtfE (RIC family)